VIFFWQIFAILHIIFWKKNILSQIRYHKNPKAQERDFLLKNSPKFSTTAYNMGQGVLKIFLLSYSEYRQIWLNTLMDDHHLSNITKLICKRNTGRKLRYMV
jgi:hypothetical protein